MPAEIYYLDDLEPGEDGEVSAVTAGANPGARILLLKKRDGHGTGRDMLPRTDPKPDELEASVPKDQTPSTGDKQELLLRLDPEQKAEFETLMKSTVEAATRPLIAKIAKFETDAAELAQARADEEEEDETRKAFVDTLPEAMRAAFLAMTNEEQAAFQAQMEAATKAGIDPLAKLAKSFEDTAKESAGLKTELAKMRSEQDLAAAVAKMRDLEKVVDVEKFAASYLKVQKVDTDAAEAMLTQTRAMAEQDKTSKLFSVVGGDGDGDGQGDGPLQKVEKKIAEIQRAAPTIERHVALDMVLKANPELFSQHQAERDAQARR